MSQFKKTAVAVLALGSSAVFAGTMGPVCAPGNVTVPCEKQAWDFGAQALILQPTYNSNLGFGNVTAASTTATRVDGLDPKWGWGFQIEGSYHFNTGNDFNLNWYHYSHSSSRTYADGALTGPFSIDPKWDAVNFEFAQHVDFTDMKSLRLHAGVQYARLATNISAFDNGEVPAFVPGALNSVNADVTFNGFGPRVGADMFFGVGNGFNIFANGAAAVLVGTNKSSVSGYPAVAAGAVSPNLSQNRNSIVPELEGKLGANYVYSMAQGDLSIDAGYMWVSYINAQSMNTLDVGSVAAVASPSEHNSNFSLSGPFFGLKWVGNV